MPAKVSPPHYMQIALDIASRIARGDLREGSKVYGRSVMASEYGVSPETIRRSLKLLADMQVVEVAPKSGVYIFSSANARKYIERFGKNINTRSLQAQLREMLAEHRELSRKIAETAAAIAKIEEMAADTVPFQNYEILVPENAFVHGKSLDELNFWQATGATIIAIRHTGEIILSPGPYAQLHCGDTIVFVGDLASLEAVEKYICEPAAAGENLP